MVSGQWNRRKSSLRTSSNDVKVGLSSGFEDVVVDGGGGAGRCRGVSVVVAIQV